MTLSIIGSSRAASARVRCSRCSVVASRKPKIGRFSEREHCEPQQGWSNLWPWDAQHTVQTPQKGPGDQNADSYRPLVCFSFGRSRCAGNRIGLSHVSASRESRRSDSRSLRSARDDDRRHSRNGPGQVGRRVHEEEVATSAREGKGPRGDDLLGQPRNLSIHIRLPRFVMDEKTSGGRIFTPNWLRYRLT